MKDDMKIIHTFLFVIMFIVTIIGTIQAIEFIDLQKAITAVENGSSNASTATLFSH